MSLKDDGLKCWPGLSDRSSELCMFLRYKASILERGASASRLYAFWVSFKTVVSTKVVFILSKRRLSSVFEEGT